MTDYGRGSRNRYDAICKRKTSKPSGCGTTQGTRLQQSKSRNRACIRFAPNLLLFAVFLPFLPPSVSHGSQLAPRSEILSLRASPTLSNPILSTFVAYLLTPPKADLFKWEGQAHPAALANPPGIALKPTRDPHDRDSRTVPDVAITVDSAMVQSLIGPIGSRAEEKILFHGWSLGETMAKGMGTTRCWWMMRSAGDLLITNIVSKSTPHILVRVWYCFVTYFFYV